MPFKWTVEAFIILPETMTIDICINFFIKVSRDHSTINVDCKSNLKKSDE